MKMRTHVLDARETESFRRFVAANGGRTIGVFQETKTDVAISWTEDPSDPVDVSDFPTWRMI